MKKISILTAVGIGDVISMTPVLNKLSAVYPNSNITILTYEGGGIS